MNFKIVKLYESNHQSFFTESYGDVDVRTSKAETKEEAKAATDSLESYSYSIENKNIIRLVIIVEDTDIKKAIEIANIKYEEIENLLKRFPIAKIRPCNDAGYWIDIDNGLIYPFLKQNVQSNILGNLYHINQGPFSRINTQQFIASGRNDELIKSYFRSIDWYSKSQQQKKKYLKFLFTWISIETIAKVNENESIVPKICTVMGFPRGNDLLKLSADTKTKLNKIPNYKIWNDYVYHHLEKSRELRNDIVHSGFKETDIEYSDLEKKIYILTFAYNNLINYIEKLILEGVSTIPDAWTNMSHQLENNENLINVISGNFIFNLENPQFMRSDDIE
jgi:hypothetical protein